MSSSSSLFITQQKVRLESFKGKSVSHVKRTIANIMVLKRAHENYMFIYPRTLTNEWDWKKLFMILSSKNWIFLPTDFIFLLSTLLLLVLPYFQRVKFLTVHVRWCSSSSFSLKRFLLQQYYTSFVNLPLVLLYSFSFLPFSFFPSLTVILKI